MLAGNIFQKKKKIRRNEKSGKVKEKYVCHPRGRRQFF